MRIIPQTDGIDLTMNPPSGSYRFKIVEETNENTVAAYARAATPAMQVTAFGVLYRDDLRIRRTAWNQWMVEVPYGTRKSELGEWTWDFDTTGGTVHITQAKEELRRYAASGSAPNQLGAIAVDGDEVKGTEIVVPAMKITVTYRHPLGIMTLAKAKALNNITGMTNSDTFLTFSPGEVLFLGARGSDGTEAEASVSYQFAMAANATGQTIGSIAGVAKRGWEIAWIRFEDIVTSDQATRVAKHVYIDRVYDEVAMASALGFGG